MNNNSYFRPAVEAMAGYVPGEQPKMANLIKLNTNENPYPPSPKVAEVLQSFDYEHLRRYPSPRADDLCETAARLYGFKRDEVIAGNGSDDILTMAFRCFTAPDRPLACLMPTYSLYFSLAEIQAAPVMPIRLNSGDFSLPADLLDRAKGANLLIITRPNAPTGNTFCHRAMTEICGRFNGVVLFDEAYADFADDNCLDLAREFDNVIVSRTLSKSYSLAGLRLGLAMGSRRLIEGMYKVKDSYNVDMLTQFIGQAALQDQAYLRQNVAKIRATRTRLTAELARLGFDVVPSSTNFVFAAPPDRDGGRFFKMLREQAILVRYFSGETTGAYVRISVGAEADVDRLLKVTELYLQMRK